MRQGREIYCHAQSADVLFSVESTCHAGASGPDELCVDTTIVRIFHRIPTAQRERSVMFGSANPTSFVGGQALLCSVMIPPSEFFESEDNVLQGFAGEHFEYPDFQGVERFTCTRRV